MKNVSRALLALMLSTTAVPVLAQTNSNSNVANSGSISNSDATGIGIGHVTSNPSATAGATSGATAGATAGATGGNATGGNGFGGSSTVQVGVGGQQTDVKIGDQTTDVVVGGQQSTLTGTLTGGDQFTTVGGQTTTVGGQETTQATDVKVGDQVVGGQQSSQSITQNFESAAPTVLPIIPAMPGAAAPQLFHSNPRDPANATGIGLIYRFLESCNSEIALGDMRQAVVAGASKRTTVNWTAYPGYRTQSEHGSVARVSTRLPAGRYNYTCLGTLTVSADDAKSAQVDLSTVVGDASQFVLRSLSSSSRVYMITVPQAIAFASGVNSSGRGLGASSGLSGLLGGAPGALLGGVLGGSLSDGRTGVQVRVGTTFIVVAIDDQNGVPLDSNQLAAYYAPISVAPTAESELPARDAGAKAQAGGVPLRH